MSRGKMADMIKSGDVRVNWRSVSKPSIEVKEGDVISCAGELGSQLSPNYWGSTGVACADDEHMEFMHP